MAREMCARACGNRATGSPQRGWSAWGDAPQIDRAPYLIDHVLKLSLCRVLAEGAHHGAQLLGRDGTIAVLTGQQVK